MTSLTTPSLPGSSAVTSSHLRRRAWRRWFARLCGALLLLGALVLLARALTAEQRAIEQMEPQARAALFQETWGSFQVVCLPQVTSGLGDRCQQEAQFLLKFPECTATCREQLDAVNHATR